MPCSCRTSAEMAPARSNTAKVSWCISTRARSSWPSVTRVSAMRGGSCAPAGRRDTPARIHQAFVDPDVVSRHATCRKASLELLPASRAIEREDGGQCCHRFVDRVHDCPGHPRPEHLLDRASPKGNHGGSTGHGLDHHEPEGFGPVDRKEQRAGLAQELSLLPVVDLSEEVNPRGGEQRLDLPLE